jgi:hypothetical protein
MEHFYENIQGWFDFMDIYSEAVRIFRKDAHFVEIGAWLGRSTAYMAVEIINSGKNIKFDVIDTWQGSPGGLDEQVYVDILKEVDKPAYDKFLENLDSVKHIINPIVGFSHDIVNNYKDESLNFIYIDGAHDYDSVKQDVEDWYPKLKKYGIIAGHDYGQIQVKEAVNEYFKNEVVTRRINSWIVYK